MRNLHYTDRSINIIVSDYTLNYLYSIEDIKKTFSEVNRLLTADGIFIVSLEYSKRSLISQ
ncbi:methyltransferase domain-containing protein [Patescibacteria group bacterium]|nr:methyltransferase domain-containing protein [Patescibacteria group bacterium]